jgi:hypothetical protein
MKNVGKWVLSAVVLAGALGLGTAKANAAQIGIYVHGGPVAYVPPSPGPGYVWVAGYWNAGYWVPGRWNYAGVVGVRRDFDRDRVYYRDRDDFRGRDRDRDRDGYRGHDRR